MGGGASKRRAEEEAEARRRAEERRDASVGGRAEEGKSRGKRTASPALKGHTSDVNAVASYTTQAGAARVVSGSCDNTIKIWDPDTQRLLATLQGHTDSRSRVGGRELHDTGRRRARRERLVKTTP